MAIAGVGERLELVRCGRAPPRARRLRVRLLGLCVGYMSGGGQESDRVGLFGLAYIHGVLLLARHVSGA